MIAVGLFVALAAAAAPPQPHALPYERLVSAADYPPAARAQRLAGTTRVTLVVGENGRVTACKVVASSGTALLDAATCRILSSRARFTPARNDRGRPVPGSVEASLTWTLPAR
jgi:protein TonB